MAIRKILTVASFAFSVVESFITLICLASGTRIMCSFSSAAILSFLEILFTKNRLKMVNLPVRPIFCGECLILGLFAPHIPIICGPFLRR